MGKGDAAGRGSYTEVAVDCSAGLFKHFPAAHGTSQLVEIQSTPHFRNVQVGEFGKKRGLKLKTSHVLVHNLITLGK